MFKVKLILETNIAHGGTREAPEDEEVFELCRDLTLQFPPQKGLVIDLGDDIFTVTTVYWVVREQRFDVEVEAGVTTYYGTDRADALSSLVGAGWKETP